MSRRGILQSIKVLGLAVILGAMPVAGANAASWGPQRTLYTNESPAPSATFNSITNNAAVGDERAFVRVAERNSGNALTNSLTIEPGKQYVVSIYYHNDAKSSSNILRDAAGEPILKNGEEQVGPGVALDVRMVSRFPTELKAGEKAEIVGKIMSTNATPQAVWAGADVTATEDMTISYVENTARIYNDWAMNGKGVSRYLFTDEGAFIGLDALNGVILGCAEYSGQVAYVIQTRAVNAPAVDPDPEPEPEEPEPEPEPTPEPVPTPTPTPDDPTVEPEPEVEVIPEELPHTGPLEIILVTLILIAIVFGFVYWNKTRKEVKKTTRSVKGKK